jgi:hypothetical protein
VFSISGPADWQSLLVPSVGQRVVLYAHAGNTTQSNKQMNNRTLLNVLCHVSPFGWAGSEAERLSFRLLQKTKSFTTTSNNFNILSPQK